MSFTHRFFRLASISVLLFSMTACIPALPTSGPVSEVEAPAGDQVADYDYLVQPPVPGADPESIIQGFLDAGANAQDDYAIAREYLTEEAAENWSADEQTLVYSHDYNLQPSGEDVYNVQLQVESRVGNDGMMSRPQESQNMTFELTQEQGQWRIAQAPDGKILDSSAFANVFDEFTLYFYDPQLRFTVPDMRWFVNRTGQAAEVVAQLLEGPAPWLAPGVVSAFHEDAALGSPTVPIQDGVATVDLSPSTTAGASDQELALMQHQLSQVLFDIPYVTEVVLSVSGSPVDVPSPSQLSEADQLDITASPRAGDTQIAVLDDQLVWQTGTNTTALSDMPDLGDIGPRFPAVPTDTTGNVVAFMDEDMNSLYHVRRDAEEPELLIEAERLTRPSMDNFGWTWTVSSEDGISPVIRAYSYSEQEGETSSTHFRAGFLEGRDVTSLRISQDGARAAVVVNDAGVDTLYIASVIRDESTGIPRGLGPHYRLDAGEDTEFEEVRWSDNTEVLVWQTFDGDTEASNITPDNIQRIRISGDLADPEEPLLGLLNVSVGEGQRNIYAEQESSNFRMLVGGSQWSDQEVPGVRDLSYPG